MIQLQFGCYCSELKVSPKNWQTRKVSLKKDWFVYYRFYDPLLKDNPKFRKGKLIVLKGMNQFKIIEERQDHTKQIIENELRRLQNKDYNPITGKFSEEETDILNPSMGFINALKLAEKRIIAAKSTKGGLRYTLNVVTKAAAQLRMDDLPISEISRKHFKQILLHIDTINKESAHRFNKLRSYLMIICNELVELEVMEVNPIRDIKKRKGIQRLRTLPSAEERQLINEYLKKNHYRFWLFMNIFFHSGSRITEMMRITKCDVDLKNQTFKILIKKGTLQKEVLKPIKNIAIDFWHKAIENANDDDYIFSHGLVPGKLPIESFQITKRWYRIIKKNLGLNINFYTLKHLNLDETAAILDINAAALMASHTSTAITIKHYAINEGLRQNERLKRVDNKFA